MSLTAIPVPSFHAALDQGGVDAVLEVIGVGEVIKTILDVSFGDRRHCKQCHHN